MEEAMKKNRILAIASILMVLAILAGCAQPAAPTSAPAPEEPAATEAPAATEPIKIGVPTLLTGVGAPMGVDVQGGAELTVEQINAEGGVLGRPLEIVMADIKGASAEDCALGAQVMDKAGVVAYFPGAFFGPACVDEFGKRKGAMQHMSASKEAVDTAIKGGYTNVFQACASEESYGPNAFNVITNSLGHTFPNQKVALLGGDITYDMYIQQAARKSFEDAGWEVILDDTYAYGNTEFGPQLAKIRAEQPAVIMGQLTSMDSAVAFMNQFLQNPTDSLIYIQWSPTSPEFINLLQEKANGVMWQTLAAGLDTPEYKAFEDAYRAKFNREVGATFSPGQNDMIRIWKAGVESCGDVEAYDCINDYIRNLSQHPFKGLMGTYGMNPERYEGLTGDEWIPMHFIQIQDKKNVTIVLGTKPIEGTQFQLPPWFE
jgi:branched-chain amino acid transport system substrate-binding protein